MTSCEKGRRYRAYIYADPERYARFRAKMRVYEARYRAKRRAIMAADAGILAAYKAYHKARNAANKDAVRVLKATDAVFYAVWRAQRRAEYAAKVKAAGKVYRPNCALRVPDWARFRQPILDTRSVFLFENRTPSQAAYARKLMREQFWRAGK